VLLQETHCDKAALSFLERNAFKDWQCHWAPCRAQRAEPPSGGANRGSAGVAILIRKRTLIQNGGLLRVVDGSFMAGRSGRLAHIKLDWLGHALHVASAYLPNAAAAQKEFIEKRLKPVAVSREVNTRTCVWGGDFNFAPDPQLDRVTDGQPAPAHGAGAATVEGAWAAHLPDLFDSFRIRHPSRRQYTFHHHRGASRLDRVYVSSKGLPFVTQAGVATRRDASGAGFLSDHRPVTMSLLQRPPHPCTAGPRYAKLRLPPRVHTEFLDDEELAASYRDGVAAEASSAPDEAGAFLEWWAAFKQRVAGLTRQLNAVYRQRHALRVEQAEAELEALEERVAAGDVAAAGDMRRARRGARRADDAATRALRARHSWLNKSELPSPGLTARLRPPVDAACGPSLRTPGGHLVSTPGACAEVMVAHCSAISAQPVVDAEARAAVLAALGGHAQLSAEAGGDMAVAAAEVKAALRTTRATAAGLDGLKVHLFRAARDTFVPLLSRLFTAIGTEDRMPCGYHTGVIVPLHKGGPDRTRAGQYRPITLLNVDYRLLAAVLAARLWPHLPDVIDPVQTAFLRDRSIGENIWFLQLLPHALEADGRSAVVAVCDFVKAFDTVDREFLFEVMRRLGASDSLMRWVTLLLRHTQARARTSPLLPTLRGTASCPRRRGLAVYTWSDACGQKRYERV
jgi:exonuclease III